MCRRQIMVTFFVLSLVLASTASAVDFVWNDDYPSNSSWCEADNWDMDDVPIGSSATAIIGEDSPDRGPVVGIGCDVDVGAITGPEPNFGRTQVIDINTSGTVRVRGDWLWRKEVGSAGTGIININGSPTVTIEGTWRGSDDGVSIVNIDGDPCVILTGGMRAADGSGWFYVNMSGGLLDIGADFLIGDNGGGELNVSGGTMIMGDELNLGGLRGSARIDVNITGGYVRTNAAFRFPGSASRAGAVSTYLRGGVVSCNEFVHGGTDDLPSYTDDWYMDIEQGMLKIDGDVKAAIDANVANGQIVAYDGEGTVVVELIDGNTVVTALPPDPNTATNPSPPNRSQNQDPNVDLGWTSGVNAAQHKIFIGTSFEDVNTMTDPCGTKARGDETYDPGTLELETTYYWRIDEVNGPTTWKGRVWYFTTKSPIVDPNMLIHLKLDETSGYIAHDSSGYGNHGAVDGNELGWDPDDSNPHDPPGGGCRNFSDVENGSDAATVIDIQSTTVLNTVDDSITVSVWLKNAYNTGGDDNWVFHCGAGGVAGPYQVGAIVVTGGTEEVLWRAGSDSNDVLTWDLDGRDPARLQDWHHWAFVKDEGAGEMRIYFDGIMRKDRSGTFNTLGFVKDTAFKIGAASYSDNYDYMGKMDDFKVFDRALTDGEIEEEYRGGDVGFAWAPSPGDYSEDVARDVNVSWRPGNYVQDSNGHRIFFGTSFDDVNDKTAPSVVQDACEYDPGLLDLDMTYYWRVEEINDPCVWTGPVWRFTVADFIIIDNFEQYDTSSNRVYNSWCDQRCQVFEETGSWLTLSKSPLYPVHTGDQSVEYWYNCDDFYAVYYYAEAWLPLEEAGVLQDWTSVDVRLLTLFFYGDPINDATETEQMYVGIEDTAGKYAELRYGDGRSDESLSDLQVPEWQSWDMPFVWFNDSNAAVANDVNLASMGRVYIGFGNRRNPVPGGEGWVNFDDIRLSLPICRPEYGPAADFSGNCIVDIADVGIMGQQWLRRDVNFLDDLGIQVQQPLDSNLVGHWKLDEGTGTFAEDSSVNNNHGTLKTTDEGGYSWVSGHIGSGAVEFGGGRMQVDDDGNTPELRPLRQVSTTAWIYIREPMSSARCVVKGKNDYETYELEFDNDDRFIFTIRDPCSTRFSLEDGVVWPGDWIHVAGTYDGNAMTSYVNGQIEETADINNPSGVLSQDLTGFAIGNKPDGDANDTPFEGMIDDVRVYDYGLSQAEVAWLASEGSGVYLLSSPVNILSGEDPEVINFRDFAALMGSWLDKKLWPE